MASVPIKPEYGPTLGHLLAPRWRAASPLARRAVQALGVAALIGGVALVLTLLNAGYAHSGRVSFSFGYRGLHRVAPDPGGYVKIEQRDASGQLQYSFAVDPLTLPPYSGEQSGALPLFASSYIEGLRRRVPGFVLIGEGRTRVNTVPAYDVLYWTAVEGRGMYGRDVLLLPQRAGAREGVAIRMLTAAGASKQIAGPMEVGTTGVLLHPLRSFSIG
jgi:hypothetical protein